MTTGEREILDAACGLVAALEPPRVFRESLRHPKHARTLAPLKSALAGLVRQRFAKQRARLLKSTGWLKDLQVTEADAALQKKLQASVTAHLNTMALFDGRVSDAEDTEYAATILAAAEGAAGVLAEELDLELSAQSIGNRFAEDYLKNRGFQKLAADVDNTSRQRIADAVAQTYANGGSYTEAVQAVKDAFKDFSDQRAETIASTELSDAYNSALLDSAKESGDLQKTWEPDGEACEEICQPNVDQGPIDLDEDFDSGDDAPPGHPNCVASGSLIAACGIAAYTARHYEGEVIVLGGPGMQDLSVTPNHPILTRRGWIAARSLKLSDRVAQCRAPGEFFAAVHPHDQHVETRIEQVADALLMADGVTSRRVPATAEAFHGDAGGDCEVDIVWAASALPDDVARDGEAYGSDGRLAAGKRGRTSLDAKRATAEILEGAMAAPHGSVGGSRLSGPLFSRHSSRAGESGGASVALLEAEQSPGSQDGRAGDSNSARDSEQALAHFVRFVRLERIERKSFNGHVFNLHTRDGFYFANTIVAHNCDCSLGFVKAE